MNRRDNESEEWKANKAVDKTKIIPVVDPSLAKISNILHVIMYGSEDAIFQSAEKYL